MKDPFLNYCFQFTVPLDYNDETSIVSKIGSIIGDNDMQAGLGIMNVEKFDCFRVTFFKNQGGDDSYDVIEAYPTPLWTVMDNIDLSFTMDELLYDGRVAEYNKNQQLVSSDFDKVLKLMSENMSGKDYQKFLIDLRLECNGSINEDTSTVDCIIEKKAVKRVDFMSTHIKYSIYLLNSDEGVIVAYDKLPGSGYENKISQSEDVQEA